MATSARCKAASAVGLAAARCSRAWSWLITCTRLVVGADVPLLAAATLMPAIVTTAAPPRTKTRILFIGNLTFIRDSRRTGLCSGGQAGTGWAQGHPL